MDIYSLPLPSTWRILEGLDSENQWKFYSFYLDVKFSAHIPVQLDLHRVLLYGISAMSSRLFLVFAYLRCVDSAFGF